MTPTDPARYAGADLRLAAVDMDGTLLDDDKNFPPGMDELLDQMDARGVTFAPASGRQVWTLIDMFPGRPGMTVIGENGGIVMRDGVEVSSTRSTPPPCARSSASCARPPRVRTGSTAAWSCAASNSPTSSAPTTASSTAFCPTTTARSAWMIRSPSSTRSRPARSTTRSSSSLSTSSGRSRRSRRRRWRDFADTHQYAISGANWADLQIRGVDKGSAVRDLQRFLGVDRSQTAVFGDAGNDLSMMSEGDLSFAMANASQDVIEASRFVAPSNNEAGVAQVLRALLG